MNIIKKTLGFLAPIKNKVMAALALIMASSVVMAQETETNQVSNLWGKLGINLADFFEKVFEALSSPVGTVLAVIFVMAIFYLVIRLASKSINPSKRVG